MLAVKKKRFDEEFAKMFGRLPTSAEFAEWCAAWGGRMKKDKCVFEPGEA
jgi:hypothetical protein